MLSFTLVAHWLACIWFIIADKEIELHKNESWDLGNGITEACYSTLIITIYVILIWKNVYVFEIIITSGH